MFYNFVEFKPWFLNQKTLGTEISKYSGQRLSVRINVLPLLAMVIVMGMAVGLNAQVTVNVFRDYDADGTDDGTGEPGIAGLTVTAYNTAGAATTLVDGGSGAYTFAGGSGPYRIEVTGVASFLHPTNAQAVVVASSGTVTIGFQSPADFCQAAPDLVTPVWCNGDPLLAGNASTFNTLVKMPYTSPTSQTNLAQGAETGATYGIAYHRTAKKVFTSAVQRRHMGYGPLGTGGIYMVDPTSLAVTNFMNLNVSPISTGTNPHTTLPSGGTTPSYDIPSYDAVGKVSLGDMDISEDEKTLWVMNLFEQTLLKVPLGGTATNPTAPAIGSVVEFAWPTPCSPSTNKFRAWGVECHQDKVYIAGLCSEEEAGGAVADLHVYIYELDPNATTPTFTLVYDFAGLNHTRGDAIDAGAQSGNWNTWKSTWATVTAAGPNNYVSLPQPMTTDLEFDKNGNIILGFSDRFGLQSGYRNYNISGSSTTLYSGATAGDIVKICKVGAAYILEGGVGCTQSYNNGTGYGGKEYYGDITSASTVLNPTTGEHEEATQGALAYNVSADAIATNMTDPEALDSGGLSWFNAAGAITDKYEVFDGTTSYVGKAAGLGDLELLCNPSTIEVGNLIWEDTDNDGIQDPNESGIGSLVVTLWKDDGVGNYSQISTTTTTSGGFYGFSNAASGTAGNGVTYNVTQLLPNMNYQIRVASGQTNNAAFTITDDDSAASGGNTTNNNKTDQRDSDANTSGVITFSTGGFGQNNYTLDIGYSPAACDVTNITFGTPSVCNDNSTNANSTDDWFTADITVTFSNTPASGNLVLSGDVLAGGGAISVTVATAGAGPTYTFTGVRLKADGTASAVTATFSADNTCTFSVTNGPNVASCSIPPCTISSVTAIPGACAPATNQYTVTGVVTFSTAPAMGTLTVQITGGGSQVFNAPFTSPLNYSIAAQTSDGASHTVTATFSANAGCTNTVNYTAPAVCPLTPCLSGNTGGMVWQDYNNDGIQTSATETQGVGGVTVRAYDCNGNLVATTTTDALGQYTFGTLSPAPSGAAPIRVEFSNWPAPYKPTANGVDGNTDVQFISAPECDVDFGLVSSVDYCQVNPKFVVPIYIDGAAATNATGLNDALYSLDYIGYSNQTTEATRTETGSVWGIGYAKKAKKVYSAAFLKRHVGLKDGKLGQIYVTDFATSGTPTTPWLDISTLGLSGNWQYLTDAQRGLGDAGTPTKDSLAFSNIAATGLGDIDVSEDETKLYVMDLTNKQLLVIDIVTKTLVGAYPVPSVCSGIAAPNYYAATAQSFTATDGKLWKNGYLFNVDNNAQYVSFNVLNPNDIVDGTTDAILYNTSARNQDYMQYSFPVVNGNYTVKLHLSTTASTWASNMDIEAEGVNVFSNLSVYVEAGNASDEGVVKTFTTTVSDGSLDINFSTLYSNGVQVSGFEIIPTSGQASGQTRPFAIKPYKGKVYVGAVCDASGSQNLNDLTGGVFEFNPLSNTFNSTPVLTIPLNYVKGPSAISGVPSPLQWFPWTSVYPNNTANGIFIATYFDVYNQPVLSDIEFDVDGSMILGFFDRMGHQMGAEPNYKPNGQLSNYGVVGGDLLRAYYNGTGYELENNGKEGVSSTKPVTLGANNYQGPGGGEFYYGDHLGGNAAGAGTAGGHYETLMGGLALLPGSDEVRATVGDPLGFISGGLGSFNNTTGDKQNGYTLYGGSTGGVQYKSNGLGDLELLCDVLPIQIGNYVWIDTDNDGVQDPCELPISGVKVELYKQDGTLIGQTTTGANGEYYFDAVNVDTIGTYGDVFTGLSPNTQYIIVVGKNMTQFNTTTQELTIAAATYELTAANTGQGASPDQNDNDGTILAGLTSGASALNGYPGYRATTPSAGSDHTFDFGFSPPCNISSITAVPGACVAPANQYTVTGVVTFTTAPLTGTMTVQITGGGSQVFNAPFTSPINYSIAAQTSDGALHTITATFSADASCTKNTTYTSPAICICDITSVTASPGACAPLTNQYVLTGVVNFVNAPAMGTLTVQITGGGSQVINAPFTSPLNYSIAAQTSDGASHTVTATFSSDPACTNTVNYMAPTNCVCATTVVSATPTSCANDLYSLAVVVTYSNSPGGNIMVTTSNGGSVTVAATSSPQTIMLTNLTANGMANIGVTAAFVSNPVCTHTLANAYNAPPSCAGCPVDNCQITTFIKN